MEQDALRLLIHRKLAQGELPHDSIPGFLGGPADGEECDACEEPISSAQFITEAISTTTNQGIQFLVECFYIWDTERDAPARRRHGLP